MNRIRYGLECLAMQGWRPWLEAVAIAITANILFACAATVAIMMGSV